MHCQLRSADRILFDGSASIVVARSPRGEFAVMDGHAPLLAVLEAGPIRIEAEDGQRVFAARHGTLRTTGDRVSVLVDFGVPLEEIDLDDVTSQLNASEEGEGPLEADERAYLAVLRQVKEQYG